MVSCGTPILTVSTSEKNAIGIDSLPSTYKIRFKSLVFRVVGTIRSQFKRKDSIVRSKNMVIPNSHRSILVVISSIKSTKQSEVLLPGLKPYWFGTVESQREKLDINWLWTHFSKILVRARSTEIGR